jgi:hypothetical protein
MALSKHQLREKLQDDIQELIKPLQTLLEKGLEL